MLDNKTAHSEKLEEGLARTASVYSACYLLAKNITERGHQNQEILACPINFYSF